MTETLYRRPLPAETIAFSSPEGRAVFGEALAGGGMDGYFPLAEQFHTQADPMFCGLGSLVVALNALAIDPGRLWKGPWRWFAEDLLDCCVALDEVRRRGLDLDELACLARCNGADVELHRASPDGLAAFRAALALAAQGDAVMIASYDRGTLDQTGTGHFSPIGGYHVARDLVLVLDVARFKYPPHWIATEKLWRSMQVHDPATDRARGYLLLRPRSTGVALGFTLRCDGDDVQGLARRLTAVARELPASADVATTARALVPLTANLVLRTPGSTVHREALAATRDALRSLSAFPLITGVVGEASAEAVLLLILTIANRLPADLRAQLAPVVADAEGHAGLALELANLRTQLAALTNVPA